MKNILLLIPALNAGGAERVMVTLANEWVKTENVTLMVFNDGESFYNLDRRVQIKAMNIMPKKGKVFRVISIPQVEIRRFFFILKEILNRKYDLVLSFCFTANIFAAIVSILLKKEKIVISERNDPSAYVVWLKILFNILYKKCDTIVCQNQMVKDYYEKRHFKNRLVILPNPVNFDDIPPIHPGETTNEIVTVGRLVEQKNHKILIDAFSDIQNEYPEWKLKIYGKGPLENYLRNLINEKGLENKVFLMGTKKRVMFEVNKSTIFVLSSNFEGFPNVLIEAMATGMPVISSDFKTGIAKKLISSEENGYLFEVGNKEELVIAMRKLLKRKDEFSKIGKNNREKVLEYNEKDVAQKWMEVLFKK